MANQPVLRAVAMIPSLYMAFVGTPLMNLCKHLNMFYEILPGGPALLAGIWDLRAMGVIVAIWSLIQLGLALLSLSPDVRVRAGEGLTALVVGGVGLADLAFAIVLVVGVVRSSAVLPWSLGRCDNAHEWATAADGRHYFIEANALRGLRDRYTPTTLCRGMIWNMEVAAILAVIYWVCACSNLVAAYPHLTRRNLYILRSKLIIAASVPIYGVAWAARWAQQRIRGHGRRDNITLGQFPTKET